MTRCRKPGSRQSKPFSDSKALAAMLPLLPAYVEETRQIFGEDFWPYGLEANRRTLEALVRYAREQGLDSRGAGRRGAV